MNRFTYIGYKNIFVLFHVLLLCSAAANAQNYGGDEYLDKRLKMVRTQITARGISDPEVLDAMRSIERHKFVSEDLAYAAYYDRPLPIGHGQTISQPYIVALMTQLLEVDSSAVVLEVGTGSGYQAAVLSEIVSRVYTIEIIEPLGTAAEIRLRRLGFQNVTVRTGDGYFGWESAAPFDAIIVTAAASHIPPPLIKQLKPGGRMAIPVGSVFFTQNLMLLEKDEEGKVTTTNVLPVSFVPLTGGH